MAGRDNVIVVAHGDPTCGTEQYWEFHSRAAANLEGDARITERSGRKHGIATRPSVREEWRSDAEQGARVGRRRTSMADHSRRGTAHGASWDQGRTTVESLEPLAARARLSQVRSAQLAGNTLPANLLIAFAYLRIAAGVLY